MTHHDADRTTVDRSFLVDGGNSRLHVGWWIDGRVSEPASIPYPASERELRETVSELTGGRDIGNIAACSVSSRWWEPMFGVLADALPGRVVVARIPSDVGMSVGYARPETIGIDRVLAAHAAYQRFGEACIVVDAGTAATVDAVSGEGVLLGGYIFPGLSTLTRSLAEKTDLPDVEPSDIFQGLGTSTESCIALAASIGFPAAVAELVRRASSAAGGTQNVIVTGGAGGRLLSCMPYPALHVQYLVLEGLGTVLDRLPVFKDNRAP